MPVHEDAEVLLPCLKTVALKHLRPNDTVMTPSGPCGKVAAVIRVYDSTTAFEAWSASDGGGVLWATEDQTVHRARPVDDAGPPPTPRTAVHLVLAHSVGLPQPWYQADGVWVSAVGHGDADAGLALDRRRGVYQFVGQASRDGEWCWENCID